MEYKYQVQPGVDVYPIYKLSRSEEDLKDMPSSKDQIMWEVLTSPFYIDPKHR